VAKARQAAATPSDRNAIIVGGSRVRFHVWLEKPVLRFGTAGAVVGIVAGLSWAAFAAPAYQVTQKGRAFRPGEIAIHRGDTVEFINDDGDLLHHVYLASDKFSFDSGDQKPGSRTDVAFPEPGTFNVLCGIHPKMKLVVNVD
jgi:plastocyanin